MQDAANDTDAQFVYIAFISSRYDEAGEVVGVFRTLESAKGSLDVKRANDSEWQRNWILENQNEFLCTGKERESLRIEKRVVQP